MWLMVYLGPGTEQRLAFLSQGYYVPNNSILIYVMWFVFRHTLLQPTDSKTESLFLALVIQEALQTVVMS